MLKVSINNANVLIARNSISKSVNDNANVKTMVYPENLR